MARKIVLHPELNIEESLKRLANSIDHVPKFTIFSWADAIGSSSKNMVGRIRGHEFFLRRPRGPFFHALLEPICLGRLDPYSHGTKILIRFRLGRPAQLIIGLYIAGAIFIVDVARSTKTILSSDWSYFAFGILILFFALLTRREERYIIDFLKSTLRVKELKSG